MSSESTPNPKAAPPSQFQWNAWGFIGGAVGPTFFLLMGAYQLRHQPGYALGLIALFLLPLLVTWVLWSRRHSLSAYTAIQWLLPFVFLSVFIGALIFYRLGITAPPLVDQPLTLPILVSIPIAYVPLALWLRFLHQRHSKAHVEAR